MSFFIKNPDNEFLATSFKTRLEALSFLEEVYLPVEIGGSSLEKFLQQPEDFRISFFINLSFLILEFPAEIGSTFIYTSAFSFETSEEASAFKDGVSFVNDSSLTILEHGFTIYIHDIDSNNDEKILFTDYNLTPDQITGYISGGGTFCPFCNSSDIEALSNLDIDKGSGDQDIFCNTCKKEWSDFYTLTYIHHTSHPPLIYIY